MRIPFVFKSAQSGMFTEQWRFDTHPVLCAGAALIVTLRGIALQEDKYRHQRSEIEVQYPHPGGTLTSIAPNFFNGKLCQTVPIAFPPLGLILMQVIS